MPDLRSLVVSLEDCDVQAILGQLQFLRHELPREANGVLLEVIAEGEVPKHLEERMVARREADILEVIVLAARANALLRGRRTLVGARLLAGEDVFELVHSCIGEQECRIVLRDERRTRDDSVSVAFEVVQESGADFGGFHEVFTFNTKPAYI